MRLCASGKLYEVEQWISDGHPIQCEVPKDRKLRERATPLQLAAGSGFHSLAALLLANGYDPNGDYYECLTPAARRRDHEMVDLLLRFGADPRAADFEEVLETYDRPLMDRFIAAGADPCARNAVACALYHKARPLLGFVKSYQKQFPGLQHQIDIALLGFVERGDEKGVALMLWLGANPYVVVPSSPHPEDAEYTGCECTFERALWSANEKILASLGKKAIPPGRVRELFHKVAFRSRPEFVRRLLDMGADPNDLDEGRPLLHSFVEALTCPFAPSDPMERDRGLEALELVLKAGARWEFDDGDIRRFRRRLMDCEGRVVSRMLELLGEYGALSSEHLHELTRTPGIEKLLSDFIKPRTDWLGSHFSPPAIQAPQPPPKRNHWKRRRSRGFRARL